MVVVVIVVSFWWWREFGLYIWRIVKPRLLGLTDSGCAVVRPCGWVQDSSFFLRDVSHRPVLFVSGRGYLLLIL